MWNLRLSSPLLHTSLLAMESFSHLLTLRCFLVHLFWCQITISMWDYSGVSSNIRMPCSIISRIIIYQKLDRMHSAVVCAIYGLGPRFCGILSCICDVQDWTSVLSFLENVLITRWGKVAGRKEGNNSCCVYPFLFIVNRSLKQWFWVHSIVDSFDWWWNQMSLRQKPWH